METHNAAQSTHHKLTMMVLIGLVVLIVVLGLILAFLTASRNDQQNENEANANQSSSQTTQTRDAYEYLDSLGRDVQVGNSIVLDADKEEVAIGDTVTVNLRTNIVHQNQGDNVASLVVGFDPTVFEVEDFTPGEVLISIGKEIDNEAGMVKLDVANNDPFVDNTVLASIVLKVKADPVGGVVRLNTDTQLGVPNSMSAESYSSLTF